MNEKRELPILNGKLLSDLDANGHKIIGVDIEFSPKKIKEAIAPELEAKADKSEVANKADKSKVWLRGGDVTGETNFAQSIKVNEISVLDEETPGSFITLNGNVNLPNGGIYCPDHPITASSFDSYMYYVSVDGAVVFNSYDEFGFLHEFHLNAIEVEQLSSNSWYVQENLRDHITHGMMWDDWYLSELGTVTITPTDEYGAYSDFYFRTNGSLSMIGELRASGIMAEGMVHCYYVSCFEVWTMSQHDEWGVSGGVNVGDNYYGVSSRLLADNLHIEDSENGIYVDIEVKDDLSLSFFYQGENITFSFSDFATLREMLNEFRASKGA